MIQLRQVLNILSFIYLYFFIRGMLVLALLKLITNGILLSPIHYATIIFNI